jgi:hydroxyacylglutathione hydrolase
VPLRVRTLPLGSLETNCYLVVDDASGEAVIVDPGADAERVRAALAAAGARASAIWLTHAHFDHVGAIADLLEVDPLPVLLHPDDRRLYDHATTQAAAYGLTVRSPEAPTSPLAHGQTLSVGTHAARCLHTPGHAPGHVAFWFEDAGVVFAGDALFQGSIGRTDIAFADHDTLLRSIREQLLTLPDDTVVYPGHGPATTICAERRRNPFLR